MDEPGYRAGNRQDFERLYRQAHPRLVRSLQPILGPSAAEDCVQEAMTRAYRAWDKWKGDAPAEAWLHRIAFNLALSYRRRERILEFVSIFHPSMAGRLKADSGRTDSDLTMAVRRLPALLAAIVVLRGYHGYSNREIASMLGVSERTVGSRWSKAMARLREDLSDQASDLEPAERLKSWTR